MKRLRISFVDVPQLSVKIKPMTSSFIDVRDLPGVDNLIENALNKVRPWALEPKSRPPCFISNAPVTVRRPMAGDC